MPTYYDNTMVSEYLHIGKNLLRNNYPLIKLFNDKNMNAKLNIMRNKAPSLAVGFLTRTLHQYHNISKANYL